MEGALPALKTLTVDFPLTPGVTSMLARALRKGAIPALQHLQIGFLRETDEDLSSLADMVEARVKIHGCQGLKTFVTREGWLDHGSLSTRVRSLRALLPSLHELAFFIWDSAYHPCFIETRPQYLEALRVHALDDASTPSRGLLESAPMLKEIHI